MFINKLICIIMNWAHLAEASWISHASGCRRSRLEVWPTEERPGFNQESGPFVMFFITKSDATELQLLKSCWKRLGISLRFYAPFYWATETELAVKFLFGSFISMIPSPEKPSTTSAKSTIKYHIRKVFALQQSFRVGEEHFKIIQIIKTFGGYENCQNQKNDARYDPKTPKTKNMGRSSARISVAKSQLRSRYSAAKSFKNPFFDG